MAAVTPGYSVSPLSASRQNSPRSSVASPRRQGARSQGHRRTLSSGSAAVRPERSASRNTALCRITHDLEPIKENLSHATLGEPPRSAIDLFGYTGATLPSACQSGISCSAAFLSTDTEPLGEPLRAAPVSGCRAIGFRSRLNCGCLGTQEEALSPSESLSELDGGRATAAGEDGSGTHRPEYGIIKTLSTGSLSAMARAGSLQTPYTLYTLHPQNNTIFLSITAGRPFWGYLNR